MKGLKIAVIGAGSTYTPELIDGFIKRKNELPVESFYLMDIDAYKLNIVGGLAKRMLDAAGMKCGFALTGSLEEALAGADFVIAQIRVGRLEARIKDEKIPLKHGLIGQETTGAGGFANALRTVPVILDIARKMERLCPDAWLINFSNPSGIVAEAVLNHSSVKMVGLCNAPYNMRILVNERVAAGCGNVSVEYIGLNHLSWITAIYCDGREVLGESFKGGSDAAGFRRGSWLDAGDDLVETVRALPVGYLMYYYYRDSKLKYLKEQPKTRGEVCVEIENELLELYRKEDLVEKPAILDKRGGHYYSEAAVSLLSAIYNDKNEVHIVDVKNRGVLDFMSYDDVVEVNCLVNRNGATPIAVGKIDNEHIKGLMRTVKCYEKHTVKAGITGDYDEALRALLMHPLVGDHNKAKCVLDEMLAAHKEYLPQFTVKNGGSI